MIVARDLLRRYPALRETWPVQRARAWRQEQSYRQHPRRMSSWFRDLPDMRTRICMSNLEMPEAPQLCKPTHVRVTLYDQDGRSVASKRMLMGRNASLVLEAHDLLPASLRNRVPSGQVQLDLEAPNLGSSRAYFHWYNDRSVTSSHEKFGLTIPAVGGYWTVPNVRHDEGYRTHLAILNIDERPYTSSIYLKDADALQIEAKLEIPPNGSRFVSLDDLFLDPGGFLGPRPGILYFGNNTQPAIYYYFILNQRVGTWRAQHL